MDLLEELAQTRDKYNKLLKGVEDLRDIIGSYYISIRPYHDRSDMEILVDEMKYSLMADVDSLLSSISERSEHGNTTTQAPQNS